MSDEKETLPHVSGLRGLSVTFLCRENLPSLGTVGLMLVMSLHAAILQVDLIVIA